MTKIAVDMLGADRSEKELLPGVVKAVETYKDLEVILYGNGDELTEELKQVSDDSISSRIFVEDAKDVVTNHENPVDAFFKKKEASLIKGMIATKEQDEIGAFASCGATGALFTAAVMALGRKAKKKPVLLCPAPKLYGGDYCIVDCGANVDCTAEDLLHFAKMGNAYMKSKGVESPKVALLSNGAEKGKGNALVKEAYALLEESGLNFVGNVEPNEVLINDVSVVVTEGFAGNVLMKNIEGTSKAVARVMAEYLKSIGALTVEGCEAGLEKVYSLTDYNDRGGAIMLGIDKPVIKGHGAASHETMFHICRIAYESAKNGLTSRVNEEM